MREVMIIVRREFRERVQTRAFLLGTLAMPVFMTAIFVLPSIIGGGGEPRRLAVVDDAPAGIGDAFVATLTAPETDDDSEYVVERVAAPFDDVRAELNTRVQAEEIDGYVALPSDLIESNRIVYRARNIANLTMLRDITRAASRAAQGERLRRAGLESAEVAELVRNVDVDQAQITAAGEEGGRDATTTFLFAYGVAFLIYFMTLLYGIAVMRSVLEEKNSRIAEVLMSSVRAQNLMLGKILGVGGAAVLQVAIWVAVIALLVTQSDRIAELFGATPDALAALSIPAGTAALFGTYFVLGFFLYAALFAAVGAAMTTEQETQSVQMIVLIPLILPLLLLVAITNEPLGGIATTLGLVPFTSPIAMPMRVAASPIPAAQVALSIALLVVALGALAWLAGKIYRIGILSTGRRASVRDIMQWLRAA